MFGFARVERLLSDPTSWSFWVRIATGMQEDVGAHKPKTSCFSKFFKFSRLFELTFSLDSQPLSFSNQGLFRLFSTGGLSKF